MRSKDNSLFVIQQILVPVNFIFFKLINEIVFCLGAPYNAVFCHSLYKYPAIEYSILYCTSSLYYISVVNYGQRSFIADFFLILRLHSRCFLYLRTQS